jgi:CubicO group peptidase (beta-lactamase class C family)
MVDISGRNGDGFGKVKDAFAENFAIEGDVGASVAVTIDGELVVDLWGGTQDEAGTVPWEEDTIINVFSTTKTMSCLSLLVLASRGLVDVDAPVARYWPEFADAGKEDTVLVRHLLSHTAGLPSWDQRLEPTDLYDWDLVCGLLAKQAPWWEPGSKSGYHGLSQGNLVGEVVRRVDGRSVGTFFAEEIAGPLGADFHIGTPPECDERIALVIPPSAEAPAGLGGQPEIPKDSIPYRAANPRLDATQSWEIPWRRAEIPAAGGHGNARSVALAQSVVSAGGTARGVELLSAETIERIFDVQSAGRDLVLGIGVTFGVGYGLNSPRAPIAPNEHVCYWGGWGGSLVVNDVDAGMTMAYVMNRMGQGTVGDDRAHRILRACYPSLPPGAGRRGPRGPRPRRWEDTAGRTGQRGPVVDVEVSVAGAGRSCPKIGTPAGHSRTAGFQSAKTPVGLSFHSHVCSTHSGSVG